MFGFYVLVVFILGSASGSVAAAPSETTVRPSASGLYTPLKLLAWDRPGCQGSLAWTIFDDTGFARNISNLFVARSFRLNRTLESQEQLDISVTSSVSTWYPNKDQMSYNSSSCTTFWQSYNAGNGSTECHNSPPFTCHRLWNNPGLPISSEHIADRTP
ncbi:hypothetical protein NYO67_8961 [Aspergillus flavus]|nr:hypothetical protein NYO67_8961 [Aspergillus flavus]